MNKAKFADSGACKNWNYAKKLAVGDTCYFELPSKYTWDAARTACPTGSTYTGSPNYQHLVDVCNAIVAQNGDGTAAPFNSGNHWTATDVNGSNYGWLVNFGSNPGYLCVANGIYAGTGFGKGYSYYVLCEGK